MKYTSLFRSMTFAATLCVVSTSHAELITFDDLTLPGGSGFDSRSLYSVVEDNYIFVSKATDQYYYVPGGGTLLVWALGTGYSADPDGATVGATYTRAPVKLSRTDGATFNFHSIDLADGYNEGSGVTIEFTFQKADGTVDTQDVEVLRKRGLQRFVFQETNLDSVSWLPVAGRDLSVQADNVNLSLVGAIPEPTTAVLMIGGLAVVGGVVRRRAAKATT